MKIEVNFDEPGTLIGGGVTCLLTWDALGDLLKQSGRLQKDEHLRAVKVTERGVQYYIEKSAD